MKTDLYIRFKNICLILTIVMLVLGLSAFPVRTASADEGLPESVYTTQAFKSIAAQDGWVLESGEISNKGGLINTAAPTIRVGDDDQDRQYLSILSFDTSGLPDNAIVVSATLKLNKQGLVGTNPFTTHSKLVIDIRKPYFGSSRLFELGDFQATSGLDLAGIVGSSPVAGYYISNLKKPALEHVNVVGLTQLRLHFQLDDNDDRSADYLSFFSGNAASLSQRPTLEIKYYVPTLPNALYYLGRVGTTVNGRFHHQIYRLAKNGKTVSQITHEGGWGVDGFDISPVDGTLVYGFGHQLIATGPNGENRRVLFEHTEDVSSPRWSPDGKTMIWRANSGLYLYTLLTDKSTLLVNGAENPSIEPFNQGFSPDGKKLALRSMKSAPDGAIYDFASKTITPIAAPPNQTICYNITWATPDSLFCSSTIAAVNHIPGLWRVNANDGSVETLISSLCGADCKLVTTPRQDVSGKLYYLYAEMGGGRPMLFSLVRSNLDGVTNRTVVRFAMYYVVDSIWTPDNASLVVHGEYDKDNLIALVLVPVNPALPRAKFLLDGSKIEQDSFHWAP